MVSLPIYAMTIVLMVNLRNSYCSITSESVKNLYKTILAGYDTRIRPQIDQNETTVFTADFRLSMLVSLDTTNQKLSISSHFSFLWRDEFLVWNTSDFHGKSYVQLRIDNIWHPTVKITTVNDGKSVIGHEDDKVMIDNSGQVHWSTEGQFNLVCNIDVTYYPFDSQECTFFVYLSDEFSSDVLLRYDETKDTNRQHKVENGEWKIIDIQTLQLLSREHKVVQLKYKLKLERRSNFMIYTAVLPLVLLFFLNSFVLIVPVRSGEKGSIAMTFLLSFSVYISSISAYLPTNSLKTPLALILMITMIVQSSLILLVSLTQSRIFHHGNMASIRQSLIYRVLCCRRVKPLIESDIDNKSEKLDEHKPKDSELFKCIDKVLFCIIFILNTIIILCFTFVIRFKSA